MQYKNVSFYIIHIVFVSFTHCVFTMLPEYQYIQQLNRFLFYACKKGRLAHVIACVEDGTNINAENDKNFTPLHVACKYGHINVVKFLVDNNANINCQTRDFLTPLHYAVRTHQAEVVYYLLNAGVNLDMQTIIGYTALDIAYEQNHKAIIELFPNQSGEDAVGHIA